MQIIGPGLSVVQALNENERNNVTHIVQISPSKLNKEGKED